MTGKILPDDPRPPSKGDKLFVPGSHRHHSASLAIPAGGWDAYAMAYRLAADVLVGHVGDNIVYSSLLGFPLLFLYRQYLELRIKEIGGAAAELLGQEYVVPIEHDLLKLWQNVRPRLDDCARGAPNSLMLLRRSSGSSRLLIRSPTPSAIRSTETVSPCCAPTTAASSWARMATRWIES